MYPLVVFWIGVFAGRRAMLLAVIFFYTDKMKAPIQSENFLGMYVFEIPLDYHPGMIQIRF